MSQHKYTHKKLERKALKDLGLQCIIRQIKIEQPIELVHTWSPSIVVIMSPLQLHVCGEGRMFDPCGDHFLLLIPIVHL